MMKKLMKKFKNERGLTLVELLAVIVILAIIGTIAFVMIGKVTENAKKDTHVANAQQLIASAKLYDSTVKPLSEQDNKVDGQDLYKEELIDILIDPWIKEPYDEPQGTVTVKDGVYSVTLNPNSDGGDCKIEDKDEKDLIKDGRKICDGSDGEDS
ncbi:type IV pilus assembly protein PilA [Pseudogracilibacillus auburnensis]|uniref:Type IV pilus assembly protein PilA n=2 Tax=Pseudogracilibacillus auburnensis TaxID=1494959 RepID=A0A2V3VXB3_9BACI|nr:type II secretion system protein [Pseudogracilibacillus auburnensis]PXW85318.1 type IV pilus assembly protein PilA [Pseudogracilibacillus auburnensis]